jgi:peptide-methionine (R)-S-oxide reductase
MKRRSLILALLAVPVAGGALRMLPSARSTSTNADIEAMQAGWRAFLPADFKPPGQSSILDLSETEWRERLTSEQFQILRKDGTERAFSSPLDKEKQRGVFACAGCELPLFSSEMKYDSGTGWPSFFTNIPNATETERDYRYGWTRVEYHCARCGGHQGHVFDDGPAPTRQRWCNNGVALKFLPAS